MRIDLVITELDTGGAEKCCAQLAHYLKHRGHRVRIIALGPRPHPPRNALLLWLEKERIEIHFLGGRRWWMLPSVVAKFKGLLKRDTPDVLQSFLWHANAVSAWVAPSLHIPFFCGVRVAEPRTLRYPVDRWITKRSTKTVCVSQGVADWCTTVEKVDAKKLVVISNGIAIANGGAIRTGGDVPSPAQGIDPDSHRVPTGARVLLFVGRLEHQKGIDVLVQYGKTLLEQLAEHHLVLIGNGSMRPMVDAFALQPELQGRVHCLGHRDDVRAWMARSELLLLPTRYEGMPNVLLEAMAEGLPIVSNRVEGVAELLGEQLQIQSSAKDNWQEFFAKVKTLAQWPEKRAMVGQANRDRVEREFDLEKQLMRYESLWHACSTTRG